MLHRANQRKKKETFSVACGGRSWQEQCNHAERMSQAAACRDMLHVDWVMNNISMFKALAATFLQIWHFVLEIRRVLVLPSFCGT